MQGRSADGGLQRACTIAGRLSIARTHPSPAIIRHVLLLSSHTAYRTHFSLHRAYFLCNGLQAKRRAEERKRTLEAQLEEKQLKVFLEAEQEAAREKGMVAAILSKAGAAIDVGHGRERRR